MTVNSKDINIGGVKLRELRTDIRLSVFKVARQIGISGNYLSQIERGERNPSDEVLYNLATYYNTDIGELFSLYNRIVPTEKEELLSNPSLKKIVTQISVDDRLSNSEKDKISKELERLYKELVDKLEI